MPIAALPRMLALWLLLLMPGWAGEPEPEALRPGEYVWAPALAPAGPMVLVVSLPEQRAYVYRNGVRIGVSTASTGKPGHETPTGVFTILQKRREHYSNLYDDAPMPYMQRLTWDGIALHAGHVPGYPASHGCVRLPYAFSRKLFEATTHGMTVVIANEASHPPTVAYPGLFAPVEADTGRVRDATPELDALDWRWQPELAPTGALTVVVSRADRQMVVLRNATEIGRARVEFASDTPLGMQAFVLLQPPGVTEDDTPPPRRWMRVDVPGYPLAPIAADAPPLAGTLSVAPAFAARVLETMTPGATVIVTDAPIRRRTTGPALTVLRADSDDTDPPANRD